MGLVVATPVLWVANARATDGPNFPPALVSSRWTGTWSGRKYLMIGVVTGVLSGALLIKMLGTPRSEPGFLIQLILFGIMQSLATFSCYAYASGRRWI